MTTHFSKSSAAVTWCWTVNSANEHSVSVSVWQQSKTRQDKCIPVWRLRGLENCCSISVCRTFQCAVSLFLIILSRPRAKLQYVCKWQLAVLQLDIHRMLWLAALTGLISIENCSWPVDKNVKNISAHIWLTVCTNHQGKTGYWKGDQFEF